MIRSTPTWLTKTTELRAQCWVLRGGQYDEKREALLSRAVGTGHSGMPSLRALIEHPIFDLVGVYVYSEAKAGRDAGDLSNTATTGVIATRNIENIIAAKPDCVVYMPVTYNTAEQAFRH